MVDGPVDQLDHGASQALYGGKMAIDGTRKWAEEGYKREWPEVATQSEGVKAHVDAPNFCDGFYTDDPITANPAYVTTSPSIARAHAAP